MKLTRLFFAILSTLIISGTVSAQFVKYANEFLNIGAGARGLGMGSAQIASVNDATAGYWNPAGLTAVKDKPQLSLMHASYFSGIAQYEFGALALPSKDGKKTFGITFLRFGVDDIPNTLYLVQPDGSINYNNITTFSSADNALLLSYAQKLNNFHGYQLSLGGTTKIIYRNVGTFANAWGFGFDAGAQLTKGNFRLGAVLKDVTTTFTAWSFSFTDQEKEVLYLTNNDIPTKSSEMTAPNLVVAGGYNFKLNNKLDLLAEANLRLTFDGRANNLISSNLLNVDPSVGMELNYNKNVFLRAGITNFQRALSDGDLTNQKKVWIYQPSLGAGFRVGAVVIDYAFTSLENQSNPLYTNIFSLKWDISKIENKVAPKKYTNKPKKTSSYGLPKSFRKY